MLTVVANKNEAIVADDRRKMYMNVSRKEAKRMTLGRVCVWKDRDVLYTVRDYYIEIGFEESTFSVDDGGYVVEGRRTGKTKEFVDFIEEVKKENNNVVVVKRKRRK